MRDYANVSQLVCLANMENLNAVFIGEGLEQQERLTRLNQLAISQMKILLNDNLRKLWKIQSFLARQECLAKSKSVTY